MDVRYSYLDRQFDDAEVYRILWKLRDLALTGDFTLGAPVAEFERRFAAMVGLPHAIGVNSGTDALILALKGLGIGPGDEVITQVNTFYATAGAIVAVGARPRFVDVGPDFAMDHTKVEACITPSTRAILPVWWHGLPPEWWALSDLAGDRGLYLIEDACPGVDAMYQERPAGWFGDAAAFSFHPLKQLNVWGDGGAVVTNIDSLADWIRRHRNHGMVGRDTIDQWGVNTRLQSVQAVVALHVLDQVHGWVNRRIEIAARLDKGLEATGHVIIPPRYLDRRHAYQVYSVTVTDRRDELRIFLAEHGVETKIHYPVPLHLQPAARDLGYKVGDFPVAEAQAKTMLSFPCHQYLHEDEIDWMIEAVARFYRS